jgi:tRNA nucleotidyltransferase (CCA-adding enzyme)
MEVITAHINADFDALGAMIAAKKLYPNAHLVFSGGGEKSVRDFFIQSTLYSLDIKALKSIPMDRITRLIIVDTRQRDRIGKFSEIVDNPDLEIHLYDHHPDSEDDLRGDFTRVEKVGSTVAIMARIIKEEKIEVTSTEATLMALGIYEDTGSFTFGSTTPADFEAAAFLVECGADLSTVANIMARTLTSEQVFVLAELIQNARNIEYKGGKIAVTEAAVEEYTDELAVCVNRMRAIENLEAVFALLRVGDRIHLIARSRNAALPAFEVAAIFGGGGHRDAASATIRDMTLIQAREELAKYLTKRLTPPKHAEDIMSFPVQSVEKAATIDQARSLMTRYNVNVLVVLEGTKPVGLVTRQLVERAAHHGLADNPVENYATGDLVFARHDASFSKLYELVVGRKQRLVPVIDEYDELVGVVTRTDILNHLLDSGTLADLQSGTKDGEGKAAHVRNLKSLLKERLPEEYLEHCRCIGRCAEKLGMTAYLVGGFVRDLILRRSNLDLDIVVEGDAIELAKAAAKELSARIALHEEFKTAVLILPDGTKVDFATARLEYYEQPAALPVVESSSIKLDLYRRDFTINTLVICINPERLGEMLDFFGAYQDLKVGHIRVLHNLSFIEDPTRILRAMRFTRRFSFQLGKHTKKLLKNAITSGILKRLDGKRLFAELKQVFAEQEPQEILKKLRDWDGLPGLDENLRLIGNQEELIDETEDVLEWFERLYLELEIEPWKVWLYGLIGHLPKKATERFLNRLDLDPKHVRDFVDGKQEAEQVLYRLNRPNPLKRSEIYRLCETLEPEQLLYVMAKGKTETSRKAVSLYLMQLRSVVIEIGGNELRALGFEPGPIYSEVLGAVLDAKLDGQVNSKDEELSFVNNTYISK